MLRPYGCAMGVSDRVPSVVRLKFVPDGAFEYLPSDHFNFTKELKRRL